MACIKGDTRARMIELVPYYHLGRLKSWSSQCAGMWLLAAYVKDLRVLYPNGKFNYVP